MALQPGDTLLNGQYRILRQLGRGGFGFVYLAQDTHLGEEVAIKELIPALVGDETTLKRFLAEAKATMRLRHERIVGTHHVFPERGNYYIVMEYMAGGSLEERLAERGALPAPEAVRIAAQVCAGLSYAHQRGVVHCDLKPANILFAPDGSAKVADFGIAHVSEQMLTRTWQTTDGFVAGTLPYMSPEQADGVRDDPRVDVYALGAVLYRMLTGSTYLDFDQRDTPGAQADNVYRIRRQQPTPPSARNRRVPAWLDDVVLKALAKGSQDRYASTDQLRAALLSGGRADVAHPPPVLPRTARPQPPPRRLARQRQVRKQALPGWFWALAGGAVVLLLIFITLLVIVGDGNGGDQLAELTVRPVPPASTPTYTEPAVPATDTPGPVDTPVPPTETPLPPTSTLEPTDTAVPPTETPIPPTVTLPPTNTPMPPTDTAVPEPQVYLYEEFGGSSLNTAVWQAYANGGNVRVQNGVLALGAPSGSTRFPYVHPKGNPFPVQGDFGVRLDFAYANSTWSGTGIVMGTELPANGITEVDKDRPNIYLFSVWQDNNLGLVISFGGYPSSSTTVYQRPRPDVSRHSVEIRNRGQVYHIWVDGQKVYQSPPTDVRPTALWFGNPVVLSASDPDADLNWTGLSVEHVSIQELR